MDPEYIMSRKCKISKKRRLVGNNVSHSNRKTKTTQEVNLRTKRFWFEEGNRWVKLRISAKMIKTISKLGFAKTLRKYGVYKELIG